MQPRGCCHLGSPYGPPHSLAAGVPRRQWRRGASRPTIVCGLQAGSDLVKSGKVRAVTAQELKALLDSGYKLLDVRPEYEYERARVKGSLHCPFFVEDKGTDPLTWIRRATHAGYSGMWNGVPLMAPNENFLCDAEKVLQGKDDMQVVVACGMGLRSLLAIEELDKAGYTGLGWLNGGLQSVGTAVDTEGEVPLEYAGVRGVAGLFIKAAEQAEKLTNKQNEM